MAGLDKAFRGQPGGVPRPAAVLALAAVYFAAAKLGLSLAIEAEQVTAVWPPTGIALAAILLLGYRVWPGILLGAFIANVTTHESVAVALAIAGGNTLEALAGAWLVRRFTRSPAVLERLSGVLAFVALAVILSTAVAATIGVTSLCLGGAQPWSAYRSLWVVWWLGDATGALVVAPWILAWSRGARGVGGERKQRRIAEAALWFTGLALTFAAVFAEPQTAGESVSYPLVYTIFPFVIWAALRFGLAGTTTATVVASAVAIWGTLHGAGPFATGAINESLRQVQLFIAVVAVTGLVLGAAIVERDVAETRRALEQAISQALSQTSILADAMPRILRTICEGLEWNLGALWIPDPHGESLHCADIWHIPALDGNEFVAASRNRTFEAGIGLPGRVWSTKLPAWIPDVTQDANFPRASVAIRAGLHGSFGFPVLAGQRVLAVMEFFSPEIRQPDEQLLQLFASIGSRMGLFIERKQAEEAYQRGQALQAAILDGAMDCFITIGHDGRILELNPAAERTFGYPRAEAVGRRLEELIVPPRLRGQHQEGLTRFLTTGENTLLGKRIEMPGLRADGTEIPLELSITAFDLHGERAFTASLRDITERKLAEQAVREANARKDEFLATLAHELRNPLAPIRNALELMRIKSDDPATVGAARRIMERQLTQLVRLVDDLLDLSRITHGTVQLRKERVDLTKVLDSALETSRAFADAAGHRLTASFPAEPILVEADPTRLAQVISNLVHNACKYTDRGGHIWLVADRSGSEATVTIRDNGIGIPPAMLTQIFEMFVQVDHSLERTSGGLGIGLTLARRLVELHGGSISAHSDGPGRGSEFVVRLPVAPDQTGTIPSAEDGHLVEPGRTGARRRILIADDNRDAADSLGAVLTMMGNEVQIAYDGFDAVAAASVFRPSVMLLDIGMPRLNGYDVARRIRAEPWGQNTVLVALTGWAQEHDRQRSAESGFDSHLVKPVSPTLLIEWLDGR